MWRKVTILLFLLVLAYTASAKPTPEMLNIDFSHQEKTSQIEQQHSSTFDNHDSGDSFNLPRLNRLSPSLFTAEIQTMPNYAKLCSSDGFLRSSDYSRII